MQRYSGWQNIPQTARGASVAIGNFDGVHLGHRSVIEVARKFGPLGIVTFEPHPREFFAPDAAPFRLMNAEARANRLAKLGVEYLYELPFDANMAAMPARDFAREILHGGLGLRHITVGQDFCFGAKRSGDGETLREFGKVFGFDVTLAPLIDLGGIEVSSTAIRRALAEGHPQEAARMLGHYHRIEGPVLHGDKRGRELGYPTANMSVTGLHLPKLGVYAVRADVLTGPQAGSYDGVASLGVRPMFGENAPNLETFLFDFKGDLYGQHLSIALVEYLRPEMKFDGLPALITQMDADSVKARDILAKI